MPLLQCAFYLYVKGYLWRLFYGVNTRYSLYNICDDHVVRLYFVYFSVDSKILARDLLADTNIEVSPDGTVSWTAPALFKSSCNINIGK